DFDHVFLDRTTGDVSGRLSLCSVIEKILKKICICQKPRIPGNEGYKDGQDHVERKKRFLNQERKDEKNYRILLILKSFLSWFKTNYLSKTKSSKQNPLFQTQTSKNTQAAIGLNTNY